ncbi:B3/4 domain-containing protein [Nonomuraea sp. NPDC050790]|uniref:B3/4 domain-containing protein n=1 Tax=Nonomuraea sp. NPDC050790 TaxID=3364371 RepID=UPI0037998D9C
MYFQHSTAMWAAHPGLVAGVVRAEGVSAMAEVGEQVARFGAIAAERLTGRTESDLPEIQAWRRTFAAMGLKPTQYRCASEALLRRFRKEGELPRIHPLIDLCNAISLAFAVPVAAIDLERVTGDLTVRHAEGDETYETFSGEVENPEPGEVVFADSAGRAHARRWTNRQSGYSAVRPGTSSVLIVAEAVHGTASVDVAKLVQALSDELTTTWHTTPASALLTPTTPRFPLT